MKWSVAMCKLLFHVDFPLFCFKRGQEYLVIHESEDHYYVQTQENVIQMIPKSLKDQAYEVFE